MKKITTTFIITLIALMGYSQETQAQVLIDREVELNSGTDNQRRMFGLTAAQDIPAAVTLTDAVNVRTIQNNWLAYKQATNVGNNYAVTLVPAPTAYIAGMLVHFRASAANTTNFVNLNVNGLGNRAIRKHGDVFLEPGDIKNGQMVSVLFDGTRFQMISQLGNPGAPPADDAWLLEGNTVAAGDFIGSLNAEDFIIRTNNTQRVNVTAGGPVSIGLLAPVAGDLLSVGEVAGAGNIAIAGYSAGENTGVYGQNVGEGEGVLGINDNENGVGVFGASVANGIGVQGQAVGDGWGVFGINNADGRGVFGVNTADGFGVLGRNDANGVGVFGQSITDNGFGVYGLNNTAGGIASFAFNPVANSTAMAVQGQGAPAFVTFATGSAATFTGVNRGTFTVTTAAGGNAVIGGAGNGGITAFTVNQGAGGSFASNTTNGVGVYGYATNAAAFGVYGTCENLAADWAGYFFGDVNATGGYFNISDARLKRNISHKSEVLSNLSALSAYSYQLIGDVTERMHYGFMADELETVHPRLVSTKKIGDQSIKVVNYIGMIPLLTQAANELNRKVEATQNGNIVTDGSGRATINLPAGYAEQHSNFRYQLTVIGGEFAQAIVSEEVVGNSFRIRTSESNIKVSWQIVGDPAPMESVTRTDGSINMYEHLPQHQAAEFATREAPETPTDSESGKGSTRDAETRTLPEGSSIDLSGDDD
ncbi:MAG: tail fiber domain-containing protein [Bernardetiaceae bacterium]|nr:tail fiber domain-containing protein [Bernardetiaceae bacterium]